MPTGRGARTEGTTRSILRAPDRPLLNGADTFPLELRMVHKQWAQTQLHLPVSFLAAWSALFRARSSQDNLDLFSVLFGVNRELQHTEGQAPVTAFVGYEMLRQMADDEYGFRFYTF